MATRYYVQMRLRVRPSEVTKGLRLVVAPHPNGVDPSLTVDKYVPAASRGVPFDFELDDAGNRVEITRDGTPYTVTITPYADWTGDPVTGSVAGIRGEDELRVATAPGEVAPPTSPGHPATMEYVDQKGGLAGSFSWVTLTPV